MGPVAYDEQLPARLRPARSRIMYVECKSGENDLEGDARIGRVFFSKSGRTLYYQGRKFQSLKGAGFKANYFDVESGGHYWISGARRDRDDRLYGGSAGVEIDEDVRLEYFAYLRGEKAASQLPTEVSDGIRVSSSRVRRAVPVGVRDR